MRLIRREYPGRLLPAWLIRGFDRVVAEVCRLAGGDVFITWRSRSFDQPMAIAADILTDRICPAAEVDTPGDPHWLVDHGILLHILYRALESQIGMGLLISSPDNRLQAFVRRF